MSTPAGSELFLANQKRCYKEQQTFDVQLYKYDETYIDYWDIYENKFRHFYDNLIYFKHDYSFLNRVINDGLDLIEYASDDFPMFDSTLFISLIKKTIDAATIALNNRD